MQTTPAGGTAAASTVRADDGPGRRRRVEVSELRASQVADYARRCAAAGDDVHVERRGGRTFVVAASP